MLIKLFKLQYRKTGSPFQMNSTPLNTIMILCRITDINVPILFTISEILYLAFIIYV